MNQWKEKIFTLMITIIEVVFIWHNLLVSANNILFFFLLLCCYLISKRTIQIQDKRKRKIALIISVIFAAIEIVCKSIQIDYTLDHVFDKWIIVNFLGYIITIGSCVIWLFYWWENKIPANTQSKISLCIQRHTENQTISFILCVCLICLAWMPYFLRYFPGIVTSDSYSQIEQTIGVIPVSNHHPITHTAIIGCCVNLGLLITKDINIGIAIYSIFSMILMAVLDTLVLKYLAKKKTSIWLRGVTLLFYMFYPINAIYSMTMWKDILFSGIVPIFLILNYELIRSPECFLEKKRNILVYIFVSLLTILLRHNGFYMVILTIPFVFILIRQYWKKALPMFLGVVLANMMIHFIFYNVLQIQKGSVVEMLSIPVQQIARVEKNHREELQQNEIESINHFFVVEYIGDKYNPILSDDVKWSMNLEYFQEHKGEFFSLWIKLMIQYPKEYVESFIANSYGYYYPEARNTAVSTVTMDHNMGIVQQPKIKGFLVEKMIKLTDSRSIPILAMCFSIGMGVWMIVICFGYQLYKKQYRTLIIYLPLFILWLTLIASPAFCEFRYAYPLILSLPIIISLNSKQEKRKGAD